MQQYQNINNLAQQVGSQPLQQYQGNIVAPLSGEQNRGIDYINSAQQTALPLINQAQGQIGASTKPLLPGIQPYLNQAQGGYQNAQGALASGGLSRVLDPYVQSAQNTFGYAGNGITFNPVGASQIAKYESPYTQQVVNATQNEFNNQNAQQQQQVKGNAISQGAFGGDRAGVAAGITAGQEQLAQAPVIAGLENQGYAQALGEANTQQQTQLQQQIAKQQAALTGAQGTAGLGAQEAGAVGQEYGLGLQGSQGIAGLGQTALGANEANSWLASQAGYGLSNLGNQLYSQTMGQGNAMLGAGGLQQQVQQEQLNVPYQQFLAQQAYPFQSTGWMANIAEGLGGASGGSSSTSSPGPSVGSQVAGAGLTGTAILGMTGAFGPSGYLTGAGAGAGAYSSAMQGALADGAMAAYAKDGGGIPHRAGGGPIGISTGVPDQSISIVPGGAGLGAGPSSPGHSSIMAPSGTTSTTKGGDSTFGSILKGAGTIAAGIYGGPAGALAAGALGSQVHFAPGGGIIHFPTNATRMPGTGRSGITANENTPHIPHPFMPRMRLAGGGGTMDDNFTAAEDDQSPGGITGSGPMDLTPMPVPPIPPQHHGRGITARALPGSGDAAMPVPPIPPDQPPPQSTGDGQGITASMDSPAPTARPVAADQSQRSPWQALLAAGLGIMGGTSPHALTNIGRGGMQGLEFGEQQRAREASEDLRRLQQEDMAEYRKGMITNTANRNDSYAQGIAERAQTAHERTDAMMAIAAQRTAAAAERANAHATPGDILSGVMGSLKGQTNPDTGQPYTQIEAYHAANGFSAKLAETHEAHQNTNDYREQRLGQFDQALDLRRQAYQETVAQHGIQNDQHAQAATASQIKGMSDQAIRIYTASKDPVTGAYQMKPEDAERVAAGFRGNAQQQQPTSAAAAPALADPLGIR